LIKNYGLTKGLVDVDGNPVENDFPHQADMCEIIRALLGNSNRFSWFNSSFWLKEDKYLTEN